MVGGISDNNEGRELGWLPICLFAVLVGGVSGVGAWLFRLLIGLIHNFLFLGEFSFIYDANIHTPASPWGVGIILVPVIGALGVVWLVKNFAPEAKGHGVPEVMDAIYFKQGRIRPVVAVVKSLASALSIGSGGSVGREGPIIQIGAAFGSTLGQVASMPTHQRNLLIAAGAGAGIAATFNVPLGGIVFAIELLLVSISARTILPVAIATVTGTYISRFLLGMSPSFDIPALQVPPVHEISPLVLVLFLPFGALIGLVAVIFTRGIYWAEDKFDSLPGGYYTRHVLGMFGVGLIIYLMQQYAGHYYLQGLGYATINDLLRLTLADPYFLLLLFALKLVVTCLTLGSGASGGVFSPSLFMGASLGAAIGHLLLFAFPGLPVSRATFAVAGMAGMIGGTTGAVVTAITMILEMTRDNHAVLPVILTVATAYGVRKALSNESIYTLKILRRGEVVPEGLEAAVDSAQRACDLMETDFQKSEESGQGRKDGGAPSPVVQVHEGAVTGLFLSGHRLSYVIVSPLTGMAETLKAMAAAKADAALVSERPESGEAVDILGVITSREIAHAACKKAVLI